MEFLKEITGKTSSLRYIFVIGMLWSMLFTSVMTVIMGWEPGEIIAVFTSNSAVFVGLKLGQKPMEKKME